MTFPVRRAPLRLRLGLLALASILLLSALFAFLPPDGLERATWAQFIGRFHLLTVHFPIALILIVPVLEWAGRKPHFPHLRSSVDFVFALAMLSSLAAAARERHGACAYDSDPKLSRSRFLHYSDCSVDVFQLDLHGNKVAS